MAVTCKVSVVDVNGRPLAGARVRLGPAGGLTDPAGRWSADLDLDPARLVTLEVDHGQHVAERCAFTGLPGRASWDNALVTPTVSGQEVLLAVRLGRMDTAPTVNLPAEQVAALMRTPARDPGGVLLTGVPRFPGVFGYARHWNDIRAVQVPRAQLLPPKPVAPGTRGWKRLQSDTAHADLAAFGRFYWLEYAPRPSRPRYAVAVWSPNLSDETPPPTLDYVVFYSPTTENEEYRGVAYPYGLVSQAAPFQKYMELAKKYLLDEFFFAYEMVAQHNRAVLVMPIADYGDLGPFSSGEGLLRALREIGLFLHRQCRTSRLGLRPPRSAHPMELAGPNLRSNTAAVVSEGFGAAPAVGRVAVAGFSTGITAVKTLMCERGWDISTVELWSTARGLCTPVAKRRNVTLDSTLWGVPAGGGVIPSGAWRESWQELWDLDGFHPSAGGWSPYLDLLQRWLGENGSRVLRSYHTSSRVPPNPLTDPHSVWKHLTGPKLDVRITLPPVAGIGAAQQLQNDRWTSVTAQDAYLGGGSDEEPVFIDPHHTTPRVGFPHALSLSKVGRAVR
ncbi:hypothetical protein ACFFMN_00275 [Planobispora siamensis]|uniref:Uncharacterized protein n=1 Tax=Planobispora siamensis TaxID=936338 RepID=A0A8J3WJR5_9ACTN|nr:hypothetical protein [Planobispora siamensis]GIH93244.1 hypothetical protein Psi01_38740 [Planobispora siamensis]